VAQDHVAVARYFASALDAEDYAAARALLADCCMYQIGDATIKGPDAIVNAYRTNGEAAKQRFDEIEYVSEVKTSGPSSAVIDFIDRLRIGDQRHQFQCRQHIRVGGGGLIEEISHEELPNERQRLAAFESGATRRHN
jgi:hypothetical protein